MLVALLTGGCLLEFDEARLGFTRACDSPGVLRCYDFDDEEDLDLRLGGPFMDDPACEDGRCGRIDTQVVASGAGALRLDTASGSGGPPIFPLNFTEDRTGIAEGEEFFVQWRQRFNAAMMRQFRGIDGFEFAGGWQQIQVTNPDPPGGEQDMCGSVQVIVTQDPRFHGPTMSHGCSSFVAIERVVDNVDVFLQTGADALCRYADGNPTAPPCIAYPIDEWVTWQLHVSVGRWNEPSSSVRLWMVRAGEPRVVVFDSDDLSFAGEESDAFGKVWLGPINYRRDTSEEHPLASTWYDELVISTQELPDPG